MALTEQKNTRNPASQYKQESHSFTKYSQRDFKHLLLNNEHKPALDVLGPPRVRNVDGVSAKFFFSNCIELSSDIAGKAEYKDSFRQSPQFL